jgi:hypothetical protein
MPREWSLSSGMKDCEVGTTKKERKDDRGPWHLQTYLLFERIG